MRGSNLAIPKQFPGTAKRGGVDSSAPEFAAAYGESASALLQRIQPFVPSTVTGLTQAFYAALDRAGPIGEIVARLEPAAFEVMKTAESEYIAEIFSSELTQAAHHTLALRAGRTHALVGVDLHWIIESFAYYQEALSRLVTDVISVPAERAPIVHVLGLRVLFDLRGQSIAFRAVGRDVRNVQAAIDRVIASTGSLFDLIHGVLHAMSELPGDVSAFFGRVDESGDLQIEATSGMADRYRQAMTSGEIPYINVHASDPAGQGPTGRAWRSGNVVVSDSWTLEPDRTPWVRVGRELGFRASAAVPIVDETGQTVAAVGIYSGYPGYFSTNRVSKLLAHLREVLGHAMAARRGGPVIPMNDRTRYRHLLEHDKVLVRYQPILDLRTGELDRLEALARLQDHSGAIVPPHEFLDALGERELYTLFTQVVRHSCIDWLDLSKQGMRTRIAINIPAHALADMQYLDGMFAILDEYGVPPRAIVLEVLETKGEPPDSARHEQFIARLRECGTEIEQDDLGSGHSSLVRMDRYPFDAVKIDQALVRGALRNPQRALEFIFYLTRLAHALQTPVTVEGLEDLGLLEAATILGADRGQGFAIAEPMPARDVHAWHAAYVHPVDPLAPQTTLGGMAARLTRGAYDKKSWMAASDA